MPLGFAELSMDPYLISNIFLWVNKYHFNSFKNIFISIGAPRDYHSNLNAFAKVTHNRLTQFLINQVCPSLR